ncbi:phosphatase PAP2 family protein [Allocoleopsis sp.]|uniref:phosphatase PAP2 family protein n=1 Tax=Allocoleopsis sp. TaxID=3088169 RepID=UPI0039C88FE8
MRSLSFLKFIQQLLIAHWRTLLLLLLGVGLPLLVFEQLAAVVWRNEGGFSWDKSILLSIHATATPQLDQIAVTLTKLGGFKGVLPVAAVISLVLLYRRQWRSLAYWLVTLLGSRLLEMQAKEFLHRVRPSLWESLSHKSSYSFPSGHAMASMTFVAALVILTWGTRWCGLILSLGSAFIIAIAWTRLYLGVHFPSDILAGWMTALAWAIGVSLVLKPRLFQPSVVSEEKLTIEEKEQVASKRHN